MRFLYPAGALLVLLFGQCRDPSQSSQPPVYYDVAGFVKSQITDLSASKPLVDKRTVVGDRLFGERFLSTRDIDWNKELELFMQADLNKPALRSSYDIARPDSLTYRYTLKPSEERLPVRSLLVRLDSVHKQPRFLEAILQTSNPLYTSHRKLSMTVGMTQARRWRIRHYEVNSSQKLPFFDRKYFFVEGTIGLRSGELGTGEPH